MPGRCFVIWTPDEENGFWKTPNIVEVKEFQYIVEMPADYPHIQLTGYFDRLHPLKDFNFEKFVAAHGAPESVEQEKPAEPKLDVEKITMPTPRKSREGIL